jgi:hypothetical protein
MPEISSLFLLFAVVLWAAIVSVPFYFILMYFRVKGIERAMWAAVSQLQAMRREDRAELDPAATRRAREAPAPTGMISTSMFGR